MTQRTLLAFLIALIFPWPASARAAAHCKLTIFAEMPVTMVEMRPTIPAKINGTEMHLLVDSGAFYSMLTPAAVAQLGLRPNAAPYGLVVGGIGGNAETGVVRVKDLAVFGRHASRVEFIVVGADFGADDAGLLGQNFLLGLGDVEYDLAHGAIRLVQPHDCKKAELAYWANSQPYSEMEIEWATPSEPDTSGVAYLNGTKIRVIFDTGAARSALSRHAAERVGVKPGDAGVRYEGLATGVGRHAVKTWVATFPSFKIGDEEIKNAKLNISDFDLGTADMLLGADFFLSHRIYVASSQRKLYFTYNGGPVFNLQQAPATSVSDGENPPTREQKDEPHDAAAFSRRGTAYLARHDVEHAISDLTRATELDPNQADFWHQLGVAHLSNKQSDVAMEDFDHALAIKADDVLTLISRAELYAQRDDRSRAIADLDAAAQAAPKEAGVREQIGHDYLELDDYAPAIAQYDLWVGLHRDDAELANVLNARCWARANQGQDLKRALADCNRALSLRPHTSEYLDSRALVQFKMGNSDKALADWDAAVIAEPKNAWFLYARGITRLRLRQTSAGQTDIDAATTLEPDIAEAGQKLGVVPP